MKIFLLIFTVIFAFLGIYTTTTYNNIIVLEENTKASWSQVLNQYKRRSDLVPNLVATVQGYATHEQETLTQVIDARAKATTPKITVNASDNAFAMDTFLKNQGALTNALSKLMVVAEKYPDLKANQNFLSLQSQLEGTENRITVARQDYIQSVNTFNKTIRKVPTKWVASLILDIEPMKTFDIEESEQAAPKVAF